MTNNSCIIEKTNRVYCKELDEINFFSALPPELRNKIKKFAIQIIYKHNENIYPAGEKNSYVYAIIEGIVKLILMKEDGKEHLISFLQEGLFGFSHIFDNEEEKLSAITIGKCRLLAVEKNKFVEILSHPAACLEFLKTVLKHNRDYLRKIEITTEKTASVREENVSQAMDIIFPNGKPAKITKTVLADFASVERETFCRVMPKSRREAFENEMKLEIAARMDSGEALQSIAEDYGITDLEYLYKIYEYVRKKPYFGMKKKRGKDPEKIKRNIMIVERMESGEKLEEIAEDFEMNVRSVYDIYQKTARKPFKLLKPNQYLERNEAIADLMDDGEDLCAIVFRSGVKYLNTLYLIYEQVRGKPFDFRPSSVSIERHRKVAELVNSGHDIAEVTKMCGFKNAGYVRKIAKKFKSKPVYVRTPM